MKPDESILAPLFDFNNWETIPLHMKIAAEICLSGATYQGTAEVRLNLVPQPSILVCGKFPDLPDDEALMVMSGQRTISSFSVNSHQVDGFCRTVKDGGGQGHVISWSPKSEPVVAVGDNSTSLVRVIFHIFNLGDIHGTRVSQEESGGERGLVSHIDLVSDQWKVDLKALFETDENVKALRANGGCRLTHVGSVEKVDGSSFSAGEAAGFLDGLRFFLSFCKGGWIEPTCAVGFDTAGNHAWEAWSSPRETWHIPLSWFDVRTGSQLATLFPVFMERWDNDEWRQALRDVIYWYLAANNSSRGVDAGIILTQTAIERLSYQFSVKHQHLLTAKGFKDLWASDKFRLLFSSLNLSLDFPDGTPELKQMATNNQINWLDAPHALTEVRNSLVHPDHTRAGQFNEVIVESWNLGLWYLEMSVLAICGYSGTYVNRLKRGRWLGETESVPWT